MNKKNYAPIVIFVYNRVSHLKKTIINLKKNKISKHSKLIIFSDGPKSTEDKIKIKTVRKFVKSINGFYNLKIYERKKNYGLSKNIINGVTEVFKQFDKAIFLEDDILVDKFFLDYMNEGLNLFKNNEKIASIHGYTYPIEITKKQSEYYFIKGADCWGWATWKRAWSIFDKNGSRLKKMIDKKNLSYEFNFNNSYDYYSMLVKQIEKKTIPRL